MNFCSRLRGELILINCKIAESNRKNVVKDYIFIYDTIRVGFSIILMIQKEVITKCHSS